MAITLSPAVKSNWSLEQKPENYLWHLILRPENDNPFGITIPKEWTLYIKKGADTDPIHFHANIDIDTMAKQCDLLDVLQCDNSWINRRTWQPQPHGRCYLWIKTDDIKRVKETLGLDLPEPA